MQLNLTAEGAKVLEETLTDYVSDLRMEIADTDQYDFREALKRKETVLRQILEQLGTTRSQTSAPRS